MVSNSQEGSVSFVFRCVHQGMAISKGGVTMKQIVPFGRRFVRRTVLSSCWFVALICFSVSIPAFAAERLIVKNGDGKTTFKVEDNGAITSASRLLSNGASSWGSAPFVLGQNLLNRGIIITDKAPTNPKNIYFGWNVGSSHEYAEIFALQEGVAYKNLILNPNAGYVGIGTNSPSYPLQMGSGAYVSAGGVWTNASSRAYKQDIKFLTREEAEETLTALQPVRFSYKTNPIERHVGFIAEDVPDLVASEDRKGMSAMDVVAVLTKVVQDQQKTIAELSRKVAALGRNKAHGEP